MDTIASVDTRQLEYFVAVADARNFTRAAERVFAAQSTVSAGIRALEREVGAALFERDPHGVRLPDAGRAVLEEARAAIDALERMRQAAAGDGELRGTVRVGIFTNLTTIDLPGIMGEFHRRHPYVDLRLGPSPSGSTGLVEDVRQGRLDIAFHGLPDAVPDLVTRPLVDSPFLAVLPEGHRLAGRRSVELADLAERVRVEGARKTPVGGEHEDRGAALGGLLRGEDVVDIGVRRDGRDGARHRVRVRQRGSDPLLRLRDARGGDELHRLRDLLGRLGRTNLLPVDPKLRSHVVLIPHCSNG